MFDVDDDGKLIYDGDVPADPDVGSLYGVTPAPAETLASEEGDPQEAPETAPSEEGEGDPSGTPLPSLESSPPPEWFPFPDVLTGSGNSALSPGLTGSGNSASAPGGLSISGGDVSLSTSGDVYIYPEGAEEEPLPEDRSSTAATVTGLPSSASLAYLGDVVDGYPSHYKYMAFKTDANYGQSMVLYIGAAGSKNPSQNRLDFTDVDRIEVNYVRSGSAYYYQYTKQHYDSYQVAYNTDVFLYTNVVDGYARFGRDTFSPLALVLILAAVAEVLAVFFRGGVKK